jgi:hypothetical protein
MITIFRLRPCLFVCVGVCFVFLCVFVQSVGPMLIFPYLTKI